MRQIKAVNHYETLKVSPDAKEQAIKEAFENLKKVYGEESSAVYSLYSQEERKAMMERIEAAYEALIDPKKRRIYDSALASGAETFSDIACYKASDASFGEAPELTELRNDIRYDIKLKKPLVVMDASMQVICEQYRGLYTKLEQINKTGGRKIVLSVTSAQEGDGKTTTAMNLAYVIARGFGKKVLLIEGDLKRPNMAGFFQMVDKRGGLVDILKGESEFNSCLYRLEKTSLFMVMAGQATDNSSELLALPLFEKMLSGLRKRFDYIIIDSPSILPFADMTVLSDLVDGLLFVVRAGKTSRNLVRTAIKAMSNSNIIGMILNDSDIAPDSYS